MTLLKKTLVAAAVFVIGGILIYQVRIRSQTSASPLGTLPPVGSDKPWPRDGGSVVEQIAKARDIKPTIDRKKELERLMAMGGKMNRLATGDLSNGVAMNCSPNGRSGTLSERPTM
jgi:hypothetical protein